MQTPDNAPQNSVAHCYDVIFMMYSATILGRAVSAWSKMDSPGYLLITNARWCAVAPVNACTPAHGIARRRLWAEVVRLQRHKIVSRRDNWKSFNEEQT